MKIVLSVALILVVGVAAAQMPTPMQSNVDQVNTPTQTTSKDPPITPDQVKPPVTPTQTTSKDPPIKPDQTVGPFSGKERPRILQCIQRIRDRRAEGGGIIRKVLGHLIGGRGAGC